MNDFVLCWMKNKNWNKWKKNYENDDFWIKRTCEFFFFRFRNINSRQNDHETIIEIKCLFLNWFFDFFFFHSQLTLYRCEKKNVILRIHTLWRFIWNDYFWQLTQLCESCNCYCWNVFFRAKTKRFYRIIFNFRIVIAKIYQNAIVVMIFYFIQIFVRFFSFILRQKYLNICFSNSNSFQLCSFSIEFFWMICFANNFFLKL